MWAQAVSAYQSPDEDREAAVLVTHVSYRSCHPLVCHRRSCASFSALKPAPRRRPVPTLRLEQGCNCSAIVPNVDPLFRGASPPTAVCEPQCEAMAARAAWAAPAARAFRRGGAGGAGVRSVRWTCLSSWPQRLGTLYWCCDIDHLTLPVINAGGAISCHTRFISARFS